jgi:hypothetical protein
VGSRKALDREAAIETAHPARGKAAMQRGTFRLEWQPAVRVITRGNIASFTKAPSGIEEGVDILKPDS